jgi:hypothetical protein
MIVTINLTVPTTLGPEVYTASNGNEYQKEKIIFLGRKVTAGV